MKWEGEKNKSFIVYSFFFFTQPLHLSVDELFKHLNQKILCAPQTCLLDETNKLLYIWKYINKYKYWE